MMTITPSLVRRLPASRMSRTATSLGNDGERRASKRSCTADDTLLTFCPPGPEERTKDSDSSDSSIVIVGVIWITDVMAGFVPAIPLKMAHYVPYRAPRVT